MAKEAWAGVQIFVEVEGPCPRKDGYLALKGKGLSYVSYADELTFKGYWPWTDAIYFDLFSFDDQGMISKVGPCPYTLSDAQINTMRVSAKQALATAQTPGEQKMLTRINERLAVIDGANLSASQGGCTDVPADGVGPDLSEALFLWETD